MFLLFGFLFFGTDAFLSWFYIRTVSKVQALILCFAVVTLFCAKYYIKKKKNRNHVINFINLSHR